MGRLGFTHSRVAAPVLAACGHAQRPTEEIDVKLMNGHTEQRVRSSDGCTVLPCGCPHAEREIVQMCDEHYAEFDARHRQARSDHDAGRAA